MSKGWQCRTYYNVNPFVGVSMHDTMGPIPAPPFYGPLWLPHFQVDVVQGLWLGAFLSKRNKDSVVSEGVLFVGRMSDAGFVVDGIEEPGFTPAEKPKAGVRWHDMPEIPPFLVVRMTLVRPPE